MAERNCKQDQKKQKDGNSLDMIADMIKTVRRALRSPDPVRPKSTQNDEVVLKKVLEILLNMGERIEKMRSEEIMEPKKISREAKTLVEEVKYQLEALEKMVQTTSHPEVKKSVAAIEAVLTIMENTQELSESEVDYQGNLLRVKEERRRKLEEALKKEKIINEVNKRIEKVLEEEKKMNQEFTNPWNVYQEIKEEIKNIREALEGTGGKKEVIEKKIEKVNERNKRLHEDMKKLLKALGKMKEEIQNTGKPLKGIVLQEEAQKQKRTAEQLEEEHERQFKEDKEDFQKVEMKIGEIEKQLESLKKDSQNEKEKRQQEDLQQQLDNQKCLHSSIAQNAKERSMNNIIQQFRVRQENWERKYDEKITELRESLNETETRSDDIEKLKKILEERMTA